MVTPDNDSELFGCRRAGCRGGAERGLDGAFKRLFVGAAMDNKGQEQRHSSDGQTDVAGSVSVWSGRTDRGGGRRTESHPACSIPLAV